MTIRKKERLLKLVRVLNGKRDIAIDNFRMDEFESLSDMLELINERDSLCHNCGLNFAVKEIDIDDYATVEVCDECFNNYKSRFGFPWNGETLGYEECPTCKEPSIAITWYKDASTNGWCSCDCELCGFEKVAEFVERWPTPEQLSGLHT